MTFPCDSVNIPVVFFTKEENQEMVIIKWTNKYRNETGYVASVSTKNECFVNTYDKENAKRYSEKSVAGIMKKLEAYHETDNNDFEFITE